VAALLGERDLRAAQRVSVGRERASPSGPSDVLHLVELFQQAQRLRFDEGRLRSLGIDARVAQSVERARRQLGSLTPNLSPREREGARESSGAENMDILLAKAILAGYPDRVARPRDKGASQKVELVLCGGGVALMDRLALPQGAELLTVLDAEQLQAGGGAAVARLVSPVSPDWLLDLPSDRVRELGSAEWNEQAERVEVIERLKYDQLVLDERRRRGDGGDAAQVELLARALRQAGLSVFADGEGIERLRQRLAFVERACPEAGLPTLDEEALASAR
jgi:hypothetical protein